MNLRLAVSFQDDAGERFFGEGPYRLLLGVEQTQSLRASAQRMGMAYTKAFRIIKNAEAHLGFPLLEHFSGFLPAASSDYRREGQGEDHPA